MHQCAGLEEQAEPLDRSLKHSRDSENSLPCTSSSRNNADILRQNNKQTNEGNRLTVRRNFFEHRSAPIMQMLIRVNITSSVIRWVVGVTLCVFDTKLKDFHTT